MVQCLLLQQKLLIEFINNKKEDKEFKMARRIKQFRFYSEGDVNRN
jgi:hypothetical protein